MRPASDTARRDVSPLLGEAEGGEIEATEATGSDIVTTVNYHSSGSL